MQPYLNTCAGSDEDLNVTSRHESVALFLLFLIEADLSLSVYPFIDPQVRYDAQTYAGKTVLITGASRGIGLETAKFYARADAALTIVGRRLETLEANKDAILREQPSALVLTFAADVRDVKKAEEAVVATIAHFGHLDILVANAAVCRAQTTRV
jgi:NADPH:quinone reductase-like Zn-dependent oxidoreductase